MLPMKVNIGGLRERTAGSSLLSKQAVPNRSEDAQTSQDVNPDLANLALNLTHRSTMLPDSKASTNG